MRFFTIAIPLALSVFVAASPVAIDNNKAVVAREASPVALEHAIEARQVPADPLAVLKGLKDVLVCIPPPYPRTLSTSYTHTCTSNSRADIYAGPPDPGHHHQRL